MEVIIIKKWNNPELMVLGVENTRSDDWAEYKPPVHSGYCHATEGECKGYVNDHADDGAASGKTHRYTGVPCPEHGPGNEACCCFGLS